MGRIVIPKEIRNYLKLEEGSPLEIGINNLGEVVLSNIDKNFSVTDFANLIGGAIADLMRSEIIFTDDKTIVASFGNNYEGKITASIIKIIEDKNTYMASVEEKTTMLPILQEKEIPSQAQVIIPYSAGGMQGAIIALNKEKSFDFAEVRNLDFVIKILEKVCR